MMRLGIVGSTRGTLMLSLIEAIQKQVLNAEISIVISNKSDALILENAKKHGLKTLFVDSSDDKLSEVLLENHVDLVVLIGYMRILSKKFVDTWAGKIINVHPSLLPLFSGLMDKQVHQAVLNAGLNESGCTVHYVTEEVDAGPIVIQETCEVRSDDTVETLRSRVQALEGKTLVAAIHKILKEMHDESRKSSR